MSERQERMLRVGCSGVFASVVDVLVLMLLVEVCRVPLAAAAFLAATSGAMASFVVNKFWAFRDHRPVHLAQVSGFVVVALGSALGTAICLQILSVGLGLPYLLAKALGAAALFMCWSYPVQSRLVFNSARS